MCSNKRSVNILALGKLPRLTKLYPRQGDQIASLYDLLSFQDKPVEGLAGRDNTRKPSGSVRTW